MILERKSVIIPLEVFLIILVTPLEYLLVERFHRHHPEHVKRNRVTKRIPKTKMIIDVKDHQTDY